MQTFLPYPSLADSAAVLDNRRLGKQRVEAWQILLHLRGERTGWSNHPAVKMWQGHAVTLCDYGIAICEEWQSRGFRDSMLARFDDLGPQVVHRFGTTPILYLPVGNHLAPQSSDLPSWFGDPDFHRSHRSNLLRKDPDWYGPRFAEPDLSDDLPYVWPAP